MRERDAKHEEFRSFVLDQLKEVEGLACQLMYGGVAIYQHGVPFAIVREGRLFFKTDSHTVSEFTEKGMQEFHPSDEEALNTYYEVPSDVLDAPEELVKWARRALIVANRQLDQ